jgi:hypothetical protein
MGLRLILILQGFKPPILYIASRRSRVAEYNKGGFISGKVTVTKAHSKTPDPSCRRLECAMV